MELMFATDEGGGSAESASAPPAVVLPEPAPASPVAWGGPRAREGRRVRLSPVSAPAEVALTAAIVAHDETTLRLRLTRPPDQRVDVVVGTEWSIDMGRSGDARYRLQGRVQTCAKASDGHDVAEVAVEVLSAERIQTRAEERVPFVARVGAVIHGQDWQRLGWLEFVDLSASGFGAGCSVPVTEGEEISARLLLPIFHVPLGFRARIVRVAPAVGSGKLARAVGGLWLSSSPLFKRLVGQYVHGASTERGARG